jgi:Protein of unknown function (DUF1706)
MKTDIKQWTLEVIATSRTEFKMLMSMIPPKQREVVGQIKQWSAKDELSHLSFWLELFAKNTKARRKGKALIDTSDYLAMNDNASEERKDWTWSEVDTALTRALEEIEKQVKALSVDELTEAEMFTLEPQRKSPRPFIKSLLYDLIDHPLHHWVKLYKKYGHEAKAADMLGRVSLTLKRPGVSKWTTTSRSKIKKHAENL